MKYPIYCIRDQKVGFQPQLLLEQSDQAAIRGFSYAINGNDGLMNYSPSDFDLFKVGEFDNEKGELIPCVPENIVSGVSVYGVNENKK